MAYSLRIFLRLDVAGTMDRHEVAVRLLEIAARYEAGVFTGTEASYAINYQPVTDGASSLLGLLRIEGDSEDPEPR